MIGLILRRVTEHVKTQNWTAVAIDFVIVVIGVFVGLQVQDWSNYRKERREELVLLGRLHVETQALLGAHSQELTDLAARAGLLSGANPVLFSHAPVRTLNAEECHAILGSHVLRRPADELPILDQMIATGRFDLLRSPGIQRILRDYIVLRERGRAYYREAVNELFRLHSRYPSLVAIVLAPNTSDQDLSRDGLSGEGYHWQHECNVEAMRENTAFLNEYADNLARINSLINFVTERQEKLIELERLLAESPANQDEQR